MIRINVILLIALLATFSASCQDNEQTNIHLNQLGYYPTSAKKAILTDTKFNLFSVKDSHGDIVYSGKLKKAGYWKQSEENVRIADFSELSREGKYTLEIKESLKSYPFEIKEDLYADAFKASLKSYYFIRASMGISEEHGGVYKRDMGHPDNKCYYHPSSKADGRTISSSKGWYDAGDYNKYVVNGGVTVGTILNLYEMFPKLVGDGFTGIPESRNGVSDLLDEVKYELDWILSMQAEDGASFFKLTSKKFTGFIMPVDDTTKRFVVGKGTAPSLNMAATTAQASRLYRKHDTEFADKCKVAAEKAWQWAVSNPGIVYKNPQDVSTGEYSDKDFTEEFWWAACELYLATGKQEYLDYINTSDPYLEMVVGESWRQFLGNIGSFSLLLSDDPKLTDLQKKLKSQLIAETDDMLASLNATPYRIAVDDFRWGSNSDIQNTAIFFAYAYKFTGEQKYLDAIVETMDYIFGKNATGYSFMTGFGSKQVENIHNRICGADGIKKPLPGLIAGGPNSRQQDETSKVQFGVIYPFSEPAKSYVDLQASYASNENCINWNAPAVFVLGFLQEIYKSPDTIK